MESRSWLGGWEKRGMTSSSVVCSYSLGHSSTFKTQKTSMGCSDYFFFQDTYSFISEGIVCQSTFDLPVRMQNPLMGNENKSS